MFNNREMQDANFVELSRRGYVVLAMDMFSHGNSENVPNIGVLETGMYEAVKMLSTINYVDTAKIGITGHSLGGMSCNVAIEEDNAAPKSLFQPSFSTVPILPMPMPKRNSSQMFLVTAMLESSPRSMTSSL